MPLIDDLSSYLAGGGTVLVGWLLGRVSRPRRTPPTSGYRCLSCRHGYGFHENGGNCREIDYGLSCQCQKYTGETPPPSYDELIKGAP